MTTASATWLPGPVVATPPSPPSRRPVHASSGPPIRSSRLSVSCRARGGGVMYTVADLKELIEYHLVAFAR